MPEASAPIRLLYLCHDPIPSHETRTEQLVQTMAALAPHGFQTTLVVPAAPGAAVSGERRHIEEIRHAYGLNPESTFPAGVVEIPSFFSSELGRAVQDIRAVRAARRLSHDLVYTRDEFALMVSVLSGLPTVFETYRADLNQLTRYWPLRRLCYSRVRGVVSHSRHAMSGFAARGIEADKLHLAYNGFSPRLLDGVPEKAEARNELGLPHDQSIVCYTGHVEERKGTSMLLALSALLPEVLFVVVGAVKGSRGEQEFRHAIEQRSLRNVRLIDRVPLPRVPVFLSAADCLIVPPSAAPLERHRKTVLPMKIFLYMAIGRPILAPRLPDVGEILTDGHNAVLVEPDNPPQAAQALAALLHDPSRAAALAMQARRDSSEYTWAARAERLAGFLRRRVRSG